MKHERELWKEVVERRQQQPLQLALSMKEQLGRTVQRTTVFVSPGHKKAGKCGTCRGLTVIRGPTLHFRQTEAKLPGLPAEAPGTWSNSLNARRSFRT